MSVPIIFVESDYFSGAGWSQGGIEDMERWVEEIEGTIAAAKKPLKVRIRY